MKKDKVIISRFENGYSVEFIPVDSTAPTDAYVFEFRDDMFMDDKAQESDEVDTFVRVLRAVDNLIGPTTGGFSPKVIRIITEKGDELDE